MDLISEYRLLGHKLCRTCLQTLGKDDDPIVELMGKSILLHPDLSQKLMILTSLSVEPTDIYPKYLCNNCCNQLTDFHEFRSRCVASLERFLELLSAAEDEKPITNQKTRINTSSKLKSCKQKPNRKSLSTFVKQDHVEPEFAELANTDIVIKSEVTTVNVNDNIAQDVSAELQIGDDNSKRCPLLEDNKVARRISRKTKKASVSTCKGNINFPRTLQYQCELCSKRFFEQHSLEAHKRTHAGLRPYPCTHEGCKNAYNRSSHLRTHMKVHEDNPEWFACTVEGCDKKYIFKATLLMHQRTVHKKDGAENKKSFICEVCGKSFKTNSLLSQHGYVHKDKSELPFACDHANCERRFSKKDKLVDHLRRHAGIKNFVCPFCGMRKTTNSELKTHINYHTRQRTWPCRMCDKVFNSSGNLKLHVGIVHELSRNYPCQYCERSFAKPYTRKYHEMTHTGEKPEVCQVCGKGFIQPTALQKHIKTHERQRSKSTTISKPNITE